MCIGRGLLLQLKPEESDTLAQCAVHEDEEDEKLLNYNVTSEDAVGIHQRCVCSLAVAHAVPCTCSHSPSYRMSWLTRENGWAWIPIAGVLGRARPNVARGDAVPQCSLLLGRAGAWIDGSDPGRGRWVRVARGRGDADWCYGASGEDGAVW